MCVLTAFPPVERKAFTFSGLTSIHPMQIEFVWLQQRLDRLAGQFDAIAGAEGYGDAVHFLVLCSSRIAA